MNFTNIKYFMTVSEELNITRAAERLHISQQALSGHISKLERELDTKLFDRNPTLSLTYAGKCLVRTGSKLLDTQSQLMSELEDINGNTRGELIIGVTHTRGQALLPSVLPAYMKAHPLIHINIAEGNALDLENSLQHGFIDLILGFLPFRTTSCAFEELAKERLFLVVPKDMMNQLFGKSADSKRLEFREGVTLSAFQDAPFILLKKGDRIRTILDQAFDKQDLHPNIILETANIQTAFALSLKGIGVCVNSEMFLKGIYSLTGDVDRDSSSELISNAQLQESEHVDFFPLLGSSTLETLAIGYSKERYLTKAASDFIELSKELFK